MLDKALKTLSVGLALLMLMGCGGTKRGIATSVDRQEQNVPADNPTSSAGNAGEMKTAHASSANTSAHVDLNDKTDPASIGRLLFGQVVAVGYQTGMKVDTRIELLVTGALADEVEGEITSDSIRNAFKEASVSESETGTASWQGRSLPAALITVKITAVNRAAGRYSEICMKLGALMDSEFDYLRDPIYVFCDDPKFNADSKIAEWKTSNNFLVKPST